VGTAGEFVAPAWAKVRELWLRFAWPVLSVVSVLGWVVTTSAVRVLPVSAAISPKKSPAPIVDRPRYPSPTGIPAAAEPSRMK